MSTLVMKFGGSLAADARSIRRVAQIISAESLAWQHMVVVVSAMAGATDSLTRAVDLAAARDGVGYRRQVAAIRAQHTAVINSLFPAVALCQHLTRQLDGWLFDVLSVLDAVCARREAQARDRDAVMAAGERMMADILIALVQSEGLRSALIRSTEWMLTDDHHQNANPLTEGVEERVERVIKPLLAAGMVTLTEGFVGATRNGTLTTLGRGGSDYSATVLAAALRADEVWVWTNVDGIMSADPSLVPNARVIDHLSYDEMRELSYFGVRVLHPRAVEPLLARLTPLRVRNPFRVDHGGTLIRAEASAGGLKAVSAIDGLLLETRQAGIDLPDVLSRVARAVGQTANGPVSVMQSQGRAALVFVVPTSEGPQAVATAAQKLSAALQSRWSVRVVKVIAALGALPNVSVPGITALASTRTEQRCILAVAPEDVQPAVRYLHRLM